MVRFSSCNRSTFMLTTAIVAVMNYTEMESKVCMKYCCPPIELALNGLAGPRSNEQ